ncbi:hypothetical protein LAB1_30440 [Roseibium sp. LAB1]
MNSGQIPGKHNGTFESALPQGAFRDQMLHIGPNPPVEPCIYTLNRNGFHKSFTNPERVGRCAGCSDNLNLREEISVFAIDELDALGEAIRIDFAILEANVLISEGKQVSRIVDGYTGDPRGCQASRCHPYNQQGC